MKIKLDAKEEKLLEKMEKLDRMDVINRYFGVISIVFAAATAIVHSFSNRHYQTIVFGVLFAGAGIVLFLYKQEQFRLYHIIKKMKEYKPGKKKSKSQRRD